MMVRAGTNFRYQPTEAHGAASSFAAARTFPLTRRSGAEDSAMLAAFMDADHLGASGSGSSAGRNRHCLRPGETPRARRTPRDPSMYVLE
jgi:hypothetical protein